jgi:hypothetical protein
MGNFYESLHVVERYTPIDATHLMYEATSMIQKFIRGPENQHAATAAWKRHAPEFKCAEYVEEMKWGDLRKKADK